MHAIKSPFSHTLLILLLFQVKIIYCQVPGFQKIFGGNDDDGAFCIIETYDEGFMIAGNTQSYGTMHGTDDILLIKTDKTGSVEWTKVYGDSLRENASCIKQTADSGYFITGRTFSHGFGAADVYLLKTDKTGNIIFFKTYGNTGYEVAQSLEITDDGGCIITGGTYSAGAGDQDLFLLKTDNIGQMQWYKIYGTSQFDHGTCIKISPAGDFIIGGRSNFLGTMDILLVKTNSQGEMLWNRLYTGSSYDESYSIALGKDNNYIISGTTNSFAAGLTDVVLIETDTLGNILDSRTYGGTETEAAYSVCANRDSGYSVAGYSEGFNNLLLQNNSVRGTDSANVFVFRVNKNLDTLWTSIYGGPLTDEGFSVIQTTDSGFVIAAVEKSIGFDSSDVYLLKTDPLGKGDCQQAYVTPVMGIANFITDTINFAIDTTGFLSANSNISVFMINMTDSAFCQPLQVSEESTPLLQLSVYPAPFSLATTIYCTFIQNKNQLTFQLIDLYGKIQLQLPITKPETLLKRGTLKSGIYFFRAFDNKTTIATGKIILLD